MQEDGVATNLVLSEQLNQTIERLFVSLLSCTIFHNILPPVNFTYWIVSFLTISCEENCT